MEAEEWANVADKEPPPKITIDQVNVSFARSGGPGGQNVNKVNTKVDMRFNVRKATWLNERVRERILQMVCFSSSKYLTIENKVLFSGFILLQAFINLNDYFINGFVKLRASLGNSFGDLILLITKRFALAISFGLQVLWLICYFHLSIFSLASRRWLSLYST